MTHLGYDPLYFLRSEVHLWNDFVYGELFLGSCFLTIFTNFRKLPRVSKVILY